MRWLDNTFLNRVTHKTLFAAAMLACLLWATASAVARVGAPPAQKQAAAVEWPHEWDGSPLRPLALSEVEERFASRFPGAIVRLASDGPLHLVMRQVNEPTRMLHPAADCYRGLGYLITQQQLEHDAQQRLWRCFNAQRGATGLRVCERIVDAKGQAFTDTSAWYWASVMARSQGPWQAITTARPL